MPKQIIKKFSAGGVLYHGGKYLIIKWGSENTYELPKGNIENGETPEQTCVREVLEETGYNTKIIAPIMKSTFMFDWKDGKTYKKTVQYYLLERTDYLESVPCREKNEDFENYWLGAKEAYEILTYDDTKAVLKKAMDIVNTNSI